MLTMLNSTKNFLGCFMYKKKEQMKEKSYLVHSHNCKEIKAKVFYLIEKSYKSLVF